MQSVIAEELATPVAEGGAKFCGVTAEHFAINGVTHQWPAASRLKWHVGFDDLGRIQSADVRNAAKTALKEIADCCNVFFEEVASAHAATLLISLSRMDGRSGVLGDCQIPVGKPNPDNTQLLMRLDTGENWGLSENPTGDLIDFYRVFLHESLHFMGLGHKPASIREPALIAPMYSPALRNLQPADKSELVRRYGPSKVAPVPPVNPTNPPRVVTGKIEVTIDGKIWVASGNLKQA